MEYEWSAATYLSAVSAARSGSGPASTAPVDGSGGLPGQQTQLVYRTVSARRDNGNWLGFRIGVAWTARSPPVSGARSAPGPAIKNRRGGPAVVTIVAMMMVCEVCRSSSCPRWPEGECAGRSSMNRNQFSTRSAKPGTSGRRPDRAPVRVLLPSWRAWNSEDVHLGCTYSTDWLG